jgi:hypothetical protein
VMLIDEMSVKSDYTATLKVKYYDGKRSNVGIL